MEHFVEWGRLVGKIPPDQLDEHVAKLLESNYSIHFHVRDHAKFGDFLKRANDYLGNPFAVEYYGQNGIEVITILRKLRPTSTAGIIPWISRLVKVQIARSKRHHDAALSLMGRTGQTGQVGPAPNLTV